MIQYTMHNLCAQQSSAHSAFAHKLCIFGICTLSFAYSAFHTSFAYLVFAMHNLKKVYLLQCFFFLNPQITQTGVASGPTPTQSIFVFSRFGHDFKPNTILNNHSRSPTPT